MPWAKYTTLANEASHGKRLRYEPAKDQRMDMNIVRRVYSSKCWQRLVVEEFQYESRPSNFLFMRK